MLFFVKHIEEVLAALILVVMLSLTFVNVVARYAFVASISYTEEITTALFVLLCMLGTAIAAKNQTHLGLSLITEQLPEKLARRVACVANLLGVAFSLALIVTGYGMVERQYFLKQITIALQWPEWIYGAFVPFGGLFMFARFLQAAVENWRAAATTEGGA